MAGAGEMDGAKCVGFGRSVWLPSLGVTDGDAVQVSSNIVEASDEGGLALYSDAVEQVVSTGLVTPVVRSALDAFQTAWVPAKQ